MERVGEIDVSCDQQDGGRGPVIHGEKEVVCHDGTIRSIFPSAGDVHEADTCPLATLANLFGQQREVTVSREDCREAKGPVMST